MDRPDLPKYYCRENHVTGEIYLEAEAFLARDLTPHLRRAIASRGLVKEGTVEEALKRYEIPPEYRKVGSFLGASRDKLTGYVERLRELSADGVKGEFTPDYGFMYPGQPFDVMPRATVEDEQGALELVLEGYTAHASRTSSLSVHSTDPSRAAEILRKHFTRKEFRVEKSE